MSDEEAVNKGHKGLSGSSYVSWDICYAIPMQLTAL